VARYTAVRSPDGGDRQRHFLHGNDSDGSFPSESPVEIRDLAARRHLRSDGCGGMVDLGADGDRIIDVITSGPGVLLGVARAAAGKRSVNSGVRGKFRYLMTAQN
jgi:hypothetical protein